MSKDVVVIVQRDSIPKQKEDIDILLISTSGECAVEEYRDFESVEAVFGQNGKSPNPKIVRKVRTLFNQGKTTLAPSLMNKVKIVGFSAPQNMEAKSAVMKITFQDSDLAEPIEASTSIYACVGQSIGDSIEKIQLNVTSRSTKWSQIAQLFKSTTISKDGVSYNAAVSGNVITFTAAQSGEVTPLIEKIELFKDSQLKHKLECNATVEFMNGMQALSAPAALVKKIQEFQDTVDDDWYFLMTDRDEDDYVVALAKFAESSEPTEAELNAGVIDRRKIYVGQTANKHFSGNIARSILIYTDSEYLSEEVDASYVGNVAPFYPKSTTWKFKRPQNGNALNSEGRKTISVPSLTEAEKNRLLEHHVNFMSEEYKQQYMKDGTCLNGEFIDVVLGGDWIAKRMRSLLYKSFMDNASIAYDDTGFGLITTAVVQALEEAKDFGIVSKAVDSKQGLYKVSMPKYSDTTEEQRDKRELPPIVWEAQLSGAVHCVKTRGVLRTSL